MKFTYLLPLLLLGSINVIMAAKAGSWWDLIPETGQRLIFSLTLFFVNLLVLSLVLYLAGLVVVGGRRARFIDAFVISLLGTILSTVFFLFIPYGLIALALNILVWLLLIKSLYKTGWLRAIVVGILAIIIFLVVTVILALLFGIFSALIERFWPFLALMF
jgi:hypothetical protein